jgi:hypothetical protein
MVGSQSATQPLRTNRRRDTLWNVLTFVILLSTLCTALAFLVIFVNPQVPFNPFPPAVMAMNVNDQPVHPVVTTGSPAIATTTPEPAKALLPAPQSSAEDTLIPTVMPAVIESTPAAPVAFSNLDYTFKMQGTPAPVSTNLIRSEVGCSWQGIAGQALDTRGSPIVGLLVKVTGTLSGKTIDLTGLTGTETRYGEGGFELQLADNPVDSTGALAIQLLDNSGLPLSQPFLFDTNAACDRNLILVNFRQVKD